jgi:hypothetical protein
MVKEYDNIIINGAIIKPFLCSLNEEGLLKITIKREHLAGGFVLKLSRSILKNW